MGKISKNALRRQKAKEKKAHKLAEVIESKKPEVKAPVEKPIKASVTSIEIDESDPTFQQFKSVLDKFSLVKPDDLGAVNTEEQVFSNDDEVDHRLDADSEGEENGTAGGSTKLSRRQERIKNKIPLAVLKAEAARPENVEWFDVDAPDARFLVYLKSVKNVVPVPGHWASKREYLSNRRAIERAAFKLPKFIEDTGIADMRDTLKEDESTLKEKMRHRVQPQMGKLDLDYRLLHNAFFQQQSKPKLYKYGEMFYEGKDFQSKFNYEQFKPGQLSAKLSSALGIPVGGVPPWVANMQRHGLPPCYPNLRVPGLNDTIDTMYEQEDVDKSHWAVLVPEEEDEEEEEEEEGDDEEEEDDEEMAENAEQSDKTGMQLEAIPITEIGNSMAVDSAPQATSAPDNRPLYQILQQQENKYTIPKDRQQNSRTEEPGPEAEPDSDSDSDGASAAKKFRF